MSHSQTASHGNDKPAAEAAKKPRDKAHEKDMILALLATDWLHGDRHFSGKLRELVLAMLTDLGEDGAEAKGRLEGMPTLVPAKAA